MYSQGDKCDTIIAGNGQNLPGRHYSETLIIFYRRNGPNEKKGGIEASGIFLVTFYICKYDFSALQTLKMKLHSPSLSCGVAADASCTGCTLT